MDQCFEEKLINEIRIHPCLFNKKYFDYRNLIKKVKAWEVISLKAGQPVDTCKARWRSLRDKFVKEHAKINHPSGSAAEEGVTWEFYESLIFLSDYIAPRKTSSSILINDYAEVCNMEALSQDMFPATPSPLPESPDAPSPTPSAWTSSSSSNYNKRKKKSSCESDQEFASFLSRMGSLAEKRFGDPKPNSAFLEVLGSKLDVLPAQERENVEMQILNLVHQKVLSMRNSTNPES